MQSLGHGLETQSLGFLVSFWTLQALVLGLRSPEPCTKLRLLQKGVIFLKNLIFRGL